MSRPSALPPEEKTRLVLSILAGEMSVAEAARKAKVSEQSRPAAKAWLRAARPVRTAGNGSM